MKLLYKARNFKPESLDLIGRAEIICQQYADAGYDLTLRQLYYQFVARGWLPNSDASYGKLGSLVNDARLAGLIDWDHLVDRTRNLSSLPTWDKPSDIMASAAYSYREDKWRDQAEYVEVWVEKEALAGVVARPTNRWQVPYFSCRGYVSQSEMHAAAMRLLAKEKAGKRVTVIHLGDHDPSGIDMTRDIRDRLELFGCWLTVKRIALNMDQVDQYNPPPNPAKITDSRASGYIDRFGDESWELDALDPQTLDALIDTEIRLHLDEHRYIDRLNEENDNKDDLTTAARRWSAVARWLATTPEDDEYGEEDET